MTLSRDRLQEVVDDAVRRGRMTRGDAEKMLSELLKRGRRQTDSLLKELERLVKQARKEVGAGQAGPQIGDAGRAPRRQETGLAPSPAPATKQDQLELEIDSLAFGGRGIARADGLVVFVSGALPGDRVRAEVTKKKKRFAEAQDGRAAAPARRPRPRHLRARRRALPGSALAGAPLRAPARPQAGAGRRGAAAGSAASRASSSRRSSRRSSSGATATSSSTPSARPRARS